VCADRGCGERFGGFRPARASSSQKRLRSTHGLAGHITGKRKRQPSAPHRPQPVSGQLPHAIIGTRIETGAAWCRRLAWSRLARSRLNCIRMSPVRASPPAAPGQHCRADDPARADRIGAEGVGQPLDFVEAEERCGRSQGRLRKLVAGLSVPHFHVDGRLNILRSTCPAVGRTGRRLGKVFGGDFWCRSLDLNAPWPPGSA